MPFRILVALAVAAVAATAMLGLDAAAAAALPAHGAHPGPSPDVCGDLGPLCGPCGIGVSSVLRLATRATADPTGAVVATGGGLLDTALWLADALADDPGRAFDLLQCAA